eukprot:g36345.t1
MERTEKKPMVTTGKRLCYLVNLEIDASGTEPPCQGNDEPVPQLVLVHLSVHSRRSSLLLVQADVIGWSELPANVGTEDYRLGRKGDLKTQLVLPQFKCEFFVIKLPFNGTIHSEDVSW